ncbi:saccharopine dehydrogenase C-terminal domain-containing protein [Sporosarcina sp. 179-K 3D1 HS]|uniref:saccharopine dehydrogenase family protein n=1 Tax=Sporosarcina sp. 179-K 3D1 HS TaxID=3232169 RepID=UPI0039A197CF
MRFFVLGAGLMGKEAVRDLLANPAVEEVIVGDLVESQALRVCGQFNDSRLQAMQTDTSNEKGFIQAISNSDVLINATVYTLNEAVARLAIDAGVHAVDLGGNVNEISRNILALNEVAKREGVTYITELGVAPGLTNILVGYGVSKFDEVETIQLRVGGLPKVPEPPLEYNQVYSIEGILYQYEGESTIIRNGLKLSVPALTEVEDIYFDGFGTLEAFHTAGGTSTLPDTFADVCHLDYKTIRYPGHAQKMKLLSELNLMKEDYFIEINGQDVRPRDVFAKVLQPIIALGDKEDVVLVRVLLEGRKGNNRMRYEFELQTDFDRENNVTAMARSTAYSISVVAQMIAKGDIQEKGVFAPEQIVPGALFVEEMKKRGVWIQEKQTIVNTN